jgi:uncharacterized protein
MRNKTLNRRRNRVFLDAELLDDATTVQLLLDEGADVDARDPEHQETALMLARSDAMRRLLLEEVAALTARDDEGSTAFMRTRNPLFLQPGVDINDQNVVGETALMKAADLGEIDQVKWLLAHGADPTLRDTAGESALDRARADQCSVLIDILTRAEATG